jgi:hypothetical protein
MSGRGFEATRSFFYTSETLIVIVCMHMKTVEKFSFSAFCADTYNLHSKQQSTTKKSKSDILSKKAVSSMRPCLACHSFLVSNAVFIFLIAGHHAPK